MSWYSAISEAVNNPKKVKGHLEKAAKLEEKEIYVDAIEEYEQALEYVPEDAAIQLRIAKAYLNSGNTKKFTSICEETAETYQEHTDAMDLLMEYYVENDSESRAVKYLENFTEDYPDNKNAAKWFTKLKGTYTELYYRYDEMSGIVNDSMVVLEDELYGIADASGQEIIASEYKDLHPFSEDGFALAQKPDGTYIYLDKDGQIRKAPDAGYENLGMFSSKSTVACKDGKYGYLDEDMKPAGKFSWDELTGFQNNAGAGKRDGKWVLVNRKGQIKDKKEAKEYDDVVIDENGFCSGQKRIFVKEGDSYYLINAKGKQIGELTFDGAKAFTGDGYAAVCKDGKWGYVDVDGDLVIDYAYEDAQSFQNGYAAVCIDDLWGYIDEKGELVIDAQFVTATKFSSSGTAAVQEEVNGEENWKLIQLNIFS